MKKRNLVLHAAIASALAVMAVGAQAGNLAGASTYAAESFGSTAAATLAIGAPSIVYTFNTTGGIVINPTGSVHVYFRVSNGKFVSAAAPTLSASIVALTVSAPVLSTDKSTVRVTLTNGTAGNVTIGIGGSVTFAQGAIQIDNVNTVLNAAGGVVNMQASVGSTSSAPDAGTALPADLDNGLTSVVAIATAAEAITSAVQASSAFTTNPETQKIDLTATSPGSRLTTGVNSGNVTVANLGSFTFSDTTGNQFAVDGAADYALATRATALSLSGTVTGSFKTGATAGLFTDTACTTALAAGSAGTLNAGLTTFTFSGETIPTAGAPTYVCLTVPATTGAIPETTPAASFTFTKATTTDAADSAAGTLFALKNNGAIVDVRSYIPAVTVGYTSFVRVINTGAVTAAVTGQWVYENGTTSTAAQLLASLPAGGSKTLTSTEIEAALGAPTASIGGNRPRLRLSAPTNTMQAQSFFLTNANGNFSDATGAQ